MTVMTDLTPGSKHNQRLDDEGLHNITWITDFTDEGTQAYLADFKSSGMDVEEWGLFCLIARLIHRLGGDLPRTPKEISEQIGVHLKTVTRLLKKLAALGRVAGVPGAVGSPHLEAAICSHIEAVKAAQSKVAEDKKRAGRASWESRLAENPELSKLVFSKSKRVSDKSKSISSESKSICSPQNPHEMGLDPRTAVRTPARTAARTGVENEQIDLVDWLSPENKGSAQNSCSAGARAPARSLYEEDRKKERKREEKIPDASAPVSHPNVTPVSNWQQAFSAAPSAAPTPAAYFDDVHLLQLRNDTRQEMLKRYCNGDADMLRTVLDRIGEYMPKCEELPDVRAYPKLHKLFSRQVGWIKADAEKSKPSVKNNLTKSQASRNPLSGARVFGSDASGDF